ncbi:MAG: biosynthetic-type acetolactate synthase large subunit [Candidatus Omnitrophica bacterium]|nr:biosynthetic-type acetolactate synthase large subunit [Candidatus Omnitrophota bacterium]
MKMRGANILVECLKREGVDTIFGYPGGAILPVFDALYDADLKLVLVRHEQGAAHMADAVGRVTGKPGVCMATSGPGATNLVTGIATAYMDSSPLVAITGQVRTYLIGNDAFQEADVIGITRPITKHSYLVKDVTQLARITREAFYIARTGRPGPVLIDLPIDIAQAETEFIYPEKVEIRGYRPKTIRTPENIDQALEMIHKSKRPVLYVGQGAIISNAARALSAFARRAGIPVTTTLLGLGAFPEDDSLALKMLGMHGTYYANHAVQNCDLLIAVGARFDDRVTGKVSDFAPKAKILHFDVDPSSVSKNVKADCYVIGEAKAILEALAKKVRKLNIPDWLEQISEWKVKHPLQYTQGEHEGLKSQYVIEEISRHSGRSTVVTTEVGQHQMWTAQFWNFTEPRTNITSGGLGTMGFGFPAAIGACFARPGEDVWCIAGDGSIQMNLQELATAVDHNLPVKVAILDNGYLGMVRQWQEIFYDKRYSYSYLPGPDYVKLAESFGALGLRATKKNEVADVIRKAQEYKGPVLAHFIVKKEDNVFPMVPAGRSNSEMIEGMA